MNLKDKINEVASSDINLKSFEVQEELQPKFWFKNKINSRVRLRLLDIANDFIKELAITNLKPKDIVLTGSIANYNWSKYSDVDLHIIVDYKKIYSKTKFIEDYFNTKKELWKKNHENLTIYGFPVEIYVEDINSDNDSTGVFSLNKNEWIKEPSPMEDAVINAKYVKNYAAKIMTQIDKYYNICQKEKDNTKIEKASKELKKIFDKLKGLRKEGLKTRYGEMSSGNIIYKIVRRMGYLDKIWDNINNTYNKINSLK